MIGKTLGHYQITEKLGEGGMGVVYCAHGEHLQRDVAVQVLPSGTFADDAARKRFHKEARFSKLNHLGRMPSSSIRSSCPFAAGEWHSSTRK